TDQNVPVTIDILANDSDVDGDSLIISHVTQADHGTLNLNSDNTITYTPNLHFNGTDSFTYTVDDGKGATDTATVILTIVPVNDAPVANNDLANTPEDTPVTIDVLANDSDVDSDVLIIFGVTQAVNGNITINSDNSLTYTPVLNFNGSDTFTYQVDDGLERDEALVTITVKQVDDPPIANPDNYNTPENTPLIVETANGVLSNDLEVDGEPLILTLLDDVDHGTVTFNNNGSFDYTPVNGFNGIDTFIYQISDGTSNDNTTVTINVSSQQDPPVAEDDTAQTDEDKPVTVDVLANDSDVDGDPLTIKSIDTTETLGLVTDNGDGTFNYNPNGQFEFLGVGDTATDTLNYTLDDGNGGTDTATVTVTIDGVNDTPDGVNDTTETDEDAPVTLDVLGNDSDVDGDRLTIISVTQSNNGTVTINDGTTLTYIPNPNFNGSDTFTYTIDDGHGSTALAAVTITINPINDSPVAEDDTYTTNEDQTLSVELTETVLSNDLDIDNNSLIASITENVKEGELTFKPDGSFTYLPHPNFNGTDQFIYQVDDGNGGSDLATVTILITGVNDPPIAVDDSYTLNEDTIFSINPENGVLGNDSDLDNDPLRANLVSTANHGTLNLSENGSFDYTPD
ncbi:MAG: Ig-like domain-containing protein, partial [Crocosphaera sp.]